MVRCSKIYNLVNNFIEPSVSIIKNTRKRRTTSHEDIRKLINIYYQRTRYINDNDKDKHKNKGFFKHVYIIHSDKKYYALKEGTSKAIKKDYKTYLHVIERGGKKDFAKIYWVSKRGKFMLQKYGKRKPTIPDNIFERLKSKGEKVYGLKDVRKANIMYFRDKGRWLIVDAERR